MTRTGQAAVDWAMGEADHASRDWYRQCKMFVRFAFLVPSDGTPDAGKAWDRAKFKHPESDSLKIPLGVPVFWEMESVADHVALGIGSGQCVSTDWPSSHDVGSVSIDRLSGAWRGRLLGWTEDIDGVRIWTPPAPEPPDPNRVQKARHDVHVAIARLERAIEAGRGEDVVQFRRDLRRALRTNVKK